jgi:hypothetical protein
MYQYDINELPAALHQRTRVGSDASRRLIDDGIVEDVCQLTIVPVE